MNFSFLIYQVAKRLPDKIALIEDGIQISYQKLWNKVEKLSAALFMLGIKTEDRVVILLPNCRQFIYVFFALLKNRMVAVPLNPRIVPFELNRIFQTANPKTIVSTSALIQKILDDNPILLSGKTIILTDTSNELKIQGSDIFLLSDLYKIKSDIHKLTTNSDQIASINFTYRGYGYPLGAVLSHGNYVYGAAAVIRLIEVELNQKFLLMMPISHIFTLICCVVTPLLRGATVIISNNIIPKHFFKIIEEYKIDFLVGVPTLYKVMLKNYDSSKYNISSVKYGLCGGDTMELSLYHEIKEKLGFELLQGYGLTETLPVTCNPKFRNKPSSLGILAGEPPCYARLRIVDDKGNEKKTGEIGEILINGRTMMKKYYKAEKESKEVIKGGWFYTGDLGRLDVEGYLYFEGLKKDIVKVGGNTVDLVEIRNVLLSYPGVGNVKIFSKLDKLWGKIIGAKIVSSKSITEKEIKNYCQKRLSGYKIPQEIKINKK